MSPHMIASLAAQPFLGVQAHDVPEFNAIYLGLAEGSSTRVRRGIFLPTGLRTAGEVTLDMTPAQQRLLAFGHAYDIMFEDNVLDAATPHGESKFGLRAVAIHYTPQRRKLVMSLGGGGKVMFARADKAFEHLQANMPGTIWQTNDNGGTDAVFNPIAVSFDLHSIISGGNRANLTALGLAQPSTGANAKPRFM